MVISKTPFRISFAGGGTDLREFYSVEPGAVISTAIDKYMYICVNRRFDHTFRISYSKTEIAGGIDEIQHPIVRECVRLAGAGHGLEITSIADIPAGTGLGSSSSFTVGLLNALYAYRGTHVAPERLASEASRIEIDILGEPIGKQDHYIAAYGGLRHIRFNPDETVSADPVVCTRDLKRELNENLMMFFVGNPRKASGVLSEQRGSTRQKADILSKMRDISIEMKGMITGGAPLDGFGRLLDSGWTLKKNMACGITTPDIDGWYAKAMSAGALGGKLLGAGGGGFMVFYVERRNRQRVRDALKALREIDFSFEPDGSRIIFVGEGAW